jgi:uncharacterized protein YndB with AHSA1/START domain
MSVKKEPSGRRSVQVEVEVKSTPEQVWQAIATGPDVSSWFVPTKIEGRVGGALSCDFGGGMVTSAQITVWQPPHRFAAEDKAGVMDSAPLATEWTVEARAGGTCVVRVVHSLFASTDKWDDQLESTEQGWPGFFRVLRNYLARHAGQRSAIMQMMATSKGSTQEIWTALQRAFGAANPRPGQRIRVQAPGAAALAATVESVDQIAHGQSMMLQVTEPVPGTVLVGAYECMGMQMASMQVYLYGDRAEAAARDQDRWQQWLAGLFPAESAAGPGPMS